MPSSPCLSYGWDPSVCLRCYVRQLRRFRGAGRTAFFHSQTSRSSRESLAEQPLPVPPLQYTPDAVGVPLPNTIKSAFDELHATNTRATTPTFDHKLDIRSRLRRWNADQDGSSRVYPTIPWNATHLNILTRPEETSQIDNAARPENNGADVDRDDEATKTLEASSNAQMVGEMLEDLQNTKDTSESPEFSGPSVERFAKNLLREYKNAAEPAARLYRGDLVELNNPISYNSVYAVYLGAADTSLYQFYTVDGLLDFRPPDAINFVQSPFTSPKEIKPLLPFLPQTLDAQEYSTMRMRHAGDIPSAVGMHLITKMRKFRNGVALVERQLAHKLREISALLMHKTDIQHMTLEEATEKISTLQGININVQSPEAQWAVSRALLQHTAGFYQMSDVHYAYGKCLSILPAKALSNAKYVMVCIRAYLEHCALVAVGAKVPFETAKKSKNIRRFVYKARSLIKQSHELHKMAGKKQVRFSAGNPGNNSSIMEHVDSQEFSTFDQQVISTLAITGLRAPFGKNHPLTSIRDLIIRAVDANGDYKISEVQRGTLQAFLIDIGVVNPHDNIRPFDLSVSRPSADVSAMLDVCQGRLEGGAKLETVGLKDIFKDTRRDWDMPVYCIDSEDTRDVDDGISVSRIPNSEDVCIHVHVAHISSFISKEHILSKAAARRLDTVYAVSERIPMLPSWATEAFSLDKDKPVLTFTATIDKSGNIKGMEIQPATIRNVFRLTPEYIDKEVFDEKQPEIEQKITLQDAGTTTASTPAARNSEPALPDSFKDDMRLLYEVLRSVSNEQAHRKKDSTYRLSTSLNVDHPQGTKVLSVLDLWPERAKFETQMPSINLKVTQTMEAQDERWISPTHGIVEQAMILAGRVTGMWAEQRNIPMIHAGTQAAVDDAGVLGEKMLEEIKTSHQPDGIFAQLFYMLAKRTLSTRPLYHAALRVPNYIRVTSPLRRYLDLVAHLQIDAVLHAERQGNLTTRKGRQSQTKAKGVVPFAREELQRLARIAFTQMENERLFVRSDRQHWMLQAISRAFYLNEAPLPNPLLVRAGQAFGQQKGLQSLLVDFGIRCFMSVTADDSQRMFGPGGNEVRPGELWECQLKEVDCAMQYIQVEPLRQAHLDGKAPNTARLGL